MQVEQPRIQVKHCKSRMRSIVHLETEQFKPFQTLCEIPICAGKRWKKYVTWILAPFQASFSSIQTEYESLF